MNGNRDSRHYTHPQVSSKRSLAPSRTINIKLEGISLSLRTRVSLQGVARDEHAFKQ
jgi:hypothetical protein